MDPAEATLSRGSQGCANLRGMMPVIVNHRNSIGSPDPLEATVHAIEVLQGLANLLHRNIQPNPHRNGRRGVFDIVFAGNAQEEFTKIVPAVTDAKAAQSIGAARAGRSAYS